MAGTRLDVEAELDRLYQLPLDQFEHARNELASRVRAEGRAATALRIDLVAKPTLSAWAVNQLYWHGRAEFDALAAVGRTLRAAQEATLQGQHAEVREASRARDAALVAALERTLDLLREGGHAPTPGTRLRIATNLDALAAYGGVPPEAPPGRLLEDLDPPGFEIFDLVQPAATAAEPTPAVTPAPERAPAKVVSFEETARARREVAEAGRLASDRRAEAQQAKAALADAQQGVKAAQAGAERAKRASEEANARVAEAEREVPERERDLERARQAAVEAEQDLERAHAALEAVRKPRGGRSE